MRKRFVPLLLLLALTGCQNLTTADLVGRVLSGSLVAAQGLFLSDTDEAKMGLETKAQVLAQTPEYPNPDLRDYVNSVGQKLVAQCERSQLHFEFHVIESKDINAFAAPGGYIFITLPCLELMQNEAQLACVLGHEVGHVAHRDAIHAIQQQMLAQGVTTAVLGSNSDQLEKLGAGIAQGLFLKGYGRSQELSADQAGALYAYKAGYDPRQLGNFLTILQKTTGDVPVWLSLASDHPRTDDRVQQLDAFIAKQGMQPDGKRIGADDFKTHVTDLVGTYTPPATATASPTPAPSPS